MTNSFVLVAKHILWANRAHIARRNVCIPSHLLPNALSLVQRCQAVGVARRNRSALPLAHILVRIRNGADVWVGPAIRSATAMGSAPARTVKQIAYLAFDGGNQAVRHGGNP